MTLGATQAGIEVVYAVERCPHAAETYRQNFPDTELLVRDIRDVTALPKKPAGVTSVVFGGPPCQGFSTSNQRTRTSANPDNWMYVELLRLAKDWNPDWIVIENVKGIRETLKGLFLTRILDSLSAEGYATKAIDLNAVDYGVPQRRERTFVLASKHRPLPSGPPKRQGPYITTADAIDDLPSLSVGASVDRLAYGTAPASPFAQSLRGNADTVTGNLVTRNAPDVIARYPHVPQGGNWADIPAHLMASYGDRTKCHTGIYRRLTSTEPSIVIGNFRKNMLIHPNQDRGLSIREAARIQSIPDDFRFSGSIGFQQQQVGNMVPPALAKAVFAEIAEN